MNSSICKVLWLDVAPHVDEAQQSMFDIGTSLSKNGVQVEYAMPHGAMFDVFSFAGMTVYPIHLKHAERRGWNIFTRASSLHKSPHSINQVARVIKPDIIHANSLEAFEATLHTPSSIPVVWHVRDLQENSKKTLSSLRRAFGVVTSSEIIDENINDIASYTYSNKLYLVRNGIEPSPDKIMDKMKIRSQYDLPEKSPLVGMVANLTPKNKHDAFIKCAALIHKILPDVHFTIIGNEVNKKNQIYIKGLKEMIDNLNLTEHFHWISYQWAPDEIIPALDILIHPQRNAAFCRSIFLAMAGNVPVIAADTGCPAIIINDKVSGRFAQDGKTENFARIAVELLRSPETRKALTGNAMNEIIKKYSSQRVAHDLDNVYSDILRKRREKQEYFPDGY